MSNPASPSGPVSLSRRNFLAATGAAASTLAMSASSYAKVIGANERIRIGFLGAGGMAGSHFNACLALKDQDNLEFLGVADCWETRANAGAEKMGAKAFTDYRKVLDIKEIDYVTIATPEHWHSKMTLDSLDAGKAVYCEKPMTHRIEEAQAVMKKQKETGLPLQVGVQLGDAWVVTGGMKQGDTVIVDGVMRIGPGAPVQVAAPPPASAASAPPSAPPSAPGGAASAPAKPASK